MQQRTWSLLVAVLSVAVLSLLVLVVAAPVGSVAASSVPAPRATELRAALVDDRARPAASNGSLSSATWLKVLTTVSPPPMQLSGMTYDPVDGYVVLFGGCIINQPGSVCAKPSDQTWIYRSGTWTNITNDAPHPSARTTPSMTWDSADGYVVLFGGGTAYGVYANDTWTFLHGTWTNITTTAGTPPAGREGASFINDTTDGYTIFCCGGSAGGNLADSWKFVGGTWTPLSASIPNRCCAPAAMDVTQGFPVLFGGGNHGALSDTEEYTGGNWVPGPSGPSARSWDSFAYDPVFADDVLFGGGNGVSYSDTWTLDASGWIQQAPANSPPARALQEEVFDWYDNYLLMFGGSATGISPNNADTWVYTDPLVLNSFNATPDPIDLGMSVNLTVNASWGVPAYSYAYAGLPGCVSANLQTLVCTPSKAGTFIVHAWVNDSAGESVKGTVVVIVEPHPTVSSFSASPDPTDVGIPTTIITVVSGGVPPFTYTYAGLPSGTSLPPGCPASVLAAFTCIPTTVGTYSLQVTATDHFGLTATGSLTLMVLADPTVSVFTAVVNPQDLGGSVTFSATAVGGTSPYSYAYLGLPPGCSSSNIASFSCVPTATGAYPVEVTATDTAGYVARAFLNATIVPDPTVSSFIPGPSPTDVGVASSLTTVVAGGVGPFHYAYSSLPTGCTSENVSVLACSASAAGVYGVWVNATDMRGYVAEGRLTLQVNPDPEVQTFSVARLPIDQGQTLSLSLTATGGTGAYSYTYTGLPGGCLTVSSPTLSCSPTTAGTFEVKAAVSDAVGGKGTGELNLTINPALKISAFFSTPSQLTVGQSAVLQVVVIGGATPYSIDYLGLPTSCNTANTTSLSCTPSATGQFMVVVEVYDSTHTSVVDYLNLTVAAAPTFLASLGGVLGLGILLLVVVVIAILVLLLYLRRRRDRDRGGAVTGVPLFVPVPEVIAAADPDEVAPEIARNPPPSAPEPPMGRGDPTAPPPSGSAAMTSTVGYTAAVTAASRLGTAASGGTPSPLGTPTTAVAAPSDQGVAMWPRLPLCLLESGEPRVIWNTVASTKTPRSDLLIITSEASTRLEAKYGLSGATIVRLSAPTGAGSIAPGDVPALLSAIKAHLVQGKYRAVVLADLDSVLAASSVSGLTRLLHEAKEAALKAGGMVLAVVDPEVIAPATLRQLEDDAAVLRPARASS